MLGNARRRAVLALCMVATAGVAGCGDDESDGSTNATELTVNASESPRVFMRKLATMLATYSAKGDCTPLEDINSRSFTKLECPASPEMRKSMRRFRIVGVEQFGSGAVVDYKSGTAKDGAAVLLFLSPVNNWGVSRFGIFTKPSTGTDDGEHREGYAAVLDDYLAAVRERDCDAFIKAAAFTADDKKTACKKTFPATKDLAKRLRRDPGAQPEYQGGNGTYGFYALETSKPRPVRSTISVMKIDDDPAKPYAVLDVAPSPTAAQQRKIQQQLTRGPNSDPNQVETSESRKAD